MPSQKHRLQVKKISPTSFNHPIILFQTPSTRATNVGFLQKIYQQLKFVPARLNFGSQRELDTYQGILETLKIPEVSRIIHSYAPDRISTITVLRETLSCSIWRALYQTGIRKHYGDAFIGATHIKDKGPIRTAYLYENNI